MESVQPLRNDGDEENLGCFLGTVLKIALWFSSMIVRLGQIFKISDLLEVQMLDDDDAENLDPSESSERTRKLKRSATQLMQVIRCCGIAILLVASALFTLALVSLLTIDEDDFQQKRAYFRTAAYAKEMYWYSLQIERMKVIHASCLVVLGAYIARMTSMKSQQLTDQHYRQILLISLGMFVLFCIPMSFILYTAYYDDSKKGMIYDDAAGEYYYSKKAINKDSSHITALLRMADWLVGMIFRSDTGLYVMFLQFFLHISIYCLLLLL